MFKLIHNSLSVIIILVTSNLALNAACYTPPAYCTNISANNVGGYGMGIQNVTLNTVALPNQINNTTSAGNGAPIYFDYTSQQLVATSGATVNYSIKGPSGNPSYIRMYIDLNQDGTFGTSAPEMILSFPSVPTSGVGNIVTGTFTLPALGSGSYRIRFASDYQNNIPGPCGPLVYSAEVEDYSLLIPSATADVAATAHTSPGFYLTGNNVVGLQFTNTSNVTITTATIGYQLGANTPITQALTGLNVTPGATYSVNFATPLNIASAGAYSMKAWVGNPNGVGSSTPANDTICRSFVVYCSGPLSGTYTIDPAGSGPTNFKSFAIADSNLITCGISGPVVFNAVAGTFNEQIWIPTIAGSSATNTITFNGAGAANTILSFNTTAANPYVVRLDGTSFITFRNMTLRSTTTNSQAWVAHINNGINNRFSKCTIEMTGAAATSGSSTLIGVLVNGSNGSSNTNSTIANNHLIDSCTINAGYYGIYTSISTSTNTISVLNNTINNSYYYGGYFSNSHIVKFNNNNVNMRTTVPFNNALYLVNCNAGGTGFHEIKNNMLYNGGQYGIYLASSSGSGSGFGQIYNNMISGFRSSNSLAGIYNSSSSRWQIWHNSINLDYAATSGTSAALYLNFGGQIEVRNNNLTVTSPTIVGGFPLYMASTTSASVLDNNNYFNKSSANLVSGAINLNASNYRVNFPAGAGLGSTNVDPQYFNNTSNLHTNIGCNTGANLGLTTDIDGQTRSTTPDIGADETSPVLNNDMSVIKINSPSFPLNAGSQSINITLKNQGANTITSVTVNYIVNGGTLNSQLISINLAPCDTLNFSFTAPFNFTGTSNLVVFTSNPNSTTDANTSNDTLSNTLCLAMSGAYTINPAGSGPTNFTSFNAAVNALNCAGVSGPVTFTVSSGNYFEQVNLLSIQGSSVTNTVTFDGGAGNAATRVLSFNATNASNPHTFRLNTSQNVVIKNLTIRSTNQNNGWPIHIMDGVNVKVENCNVWVDSLGVNSSNSNLAAIVINGNNTNTTTGSSMINNVFIDNNNIKGGYFGIVSQGTSQATIANTLYFRNNTIDSTFYYGIYFGSNTVKCLNNTVNMRFNGSANSIGIYCGQVQNNTNGMFCEINANKVFNAGQYGMSLGNFYSVNGWNHRVLNNMVGKFRTTGGVQTFGMNFNFSFYVDVDHNTINVDNPTTGGNRALYMAIYGPANVRNNIFTIMNASATNAIPVQFATSNAPVLTNNNYFNTLNSNIIQTPNGTFTTTALTTAFPTGGGAGSLNINPQYPSSSDLHLGAAIGANTFNSTLNLTATVPIDIDNQSRNGTPDMGADEKSLNDVGVSAILAPLTVNPGVYAIQVRIRNFGSNAVSNIPVRYSLNGGALVNETYVPSIAGNDSATYTFTTTATFIACNSIKVFTDLATETYRANDSTNLSIGPNISGIYTINPSGSGPTNFTSFANALVFLSCGLVTGPVRFDVAAATYTEQVSIPSTIRGVSAVNTITFDGGNGNASTRILTFAPTASPNWHVLRFNGCSNIAFRNITIRSTNTTGSAWTAHFFNGTNNRLNNCVIDMVGNPTGNSNFSNIVVNGSYTSMGTNTTIANNILVDSCTINNGYYNIYTSASGGGNNTFRFLYNTLTNAYQYGAYFSNSHVIKFNYNKVTLGTLSTSPYGLFLTSNNLSGNFFHEINHNNFNSIGVYGIYLTSSSGSSTVNSQIYNNFMNGFRYSFGTYGIYNSSSSYWNIYHNTINLDAPNTSGTSACIALNFGSNTDVRNNILTVMNPSVVNSFPMWASSTTVASSLDNNIYFNRSNSNLVFIAGNTYNASNFKIAYPNGGGVNSINTDPSYLSTTNLHVSNGCNNGANLGILLDIDGNARGTSPDIGADEVISLPNNDIQVSSITNPTFPLVSGSQPVTVVIKNLGNNTVSTFNVNYILNNGTVVTQAYSGAPIPSCGTAIFTFSTNVTIVNGANNLKVFTNAPNGSADAIPANDTAQFNLCSAMNGVYTINPAGSGPTNFTSFTAAVNALICGGVNGPVSFNVSNGTYTEQIQIPAIQGTSSTNTIAFTSVSGNPTLCTLTFTPVTGGSYTLYLNGADYVSFNKITIANGYTASTVYTVWIGGKSEYNTISACTIANPSNPNAYGIYQSNTTDNYNTFIGNTITNGYIGIIMQSNTSVYSVKNSFINNILTNQTGYAIYSYFQDSVTISGNIITTNATTGSYYGIFTQSNGKFPIVTKNKITGINMTSSGYGMQHNSFANNGFSFGRGLIANNFVQMGGTATTNVGIHINGGTNYTDIVHNSVNMTSTVLSPNVSCFRYEQFLSNNNVQNNIFQASGNGTTSCAVANIGTNGTSGCIFNYNNWYGLNSTTFGYSGTAMGTAQNSYAAFKTGGAGIASFEANGFNKEVLFNSTTDLHTSSPCLSNSGTNLLSIVPKDIDDETRTSTPDIGADEFNVSAYDAAMQAIVSPSGTSFATGIPYTVKVKVRNNGSNTITALNMNYSINGTVTSQAFTGLNIASCDTLTLTFTATLTLTTPGSNVFKIFNGLINTTNADLNNVNDTIVLNLCTPYSGTYVINKNLPFSTSNFASINQAVNAMYSCGVSGPVILRIAAGSGPYNEQVNFSGVIPGSNRLATVTLSGNTTREIVSFGTGGTATQHVIRLSGAKHIKLDSLTINNPGTGYGIGVHITGGADSNFVQNSIINISLASTSFSNSAGVAISSTAASATGTGNNGNSNRIFNNTINGGYYGITALGTNTTIFCLRNDISNNVLNGQAYYGIFTQYQDLIKINGNTIDNMLSSNTNSAGLYCAYVERFELKKNKINRSGQYGMNLNYMNYQLGTGTARSEISNNMIGGTFYSTNPYGLYLANQGRHIDIWHNSIHVINMGSGYGFYFQYQTSGTYEGLDFANNTITATNNTNYVSWMYWSTGLTPSNPIINFMSNNIWSPNTTSSLAVFNQNGYTGAGWISANTNGLNTLTCKNLDPQYLNESTNLHINQGNLNDVGTNLSQVNSDIDGDIRPLAPSSTVDIGADEFAVPALNIGPVALVSPTAPLTSGLQDVVVKIKNFGSATVTSANVSYKVGFNGSIKTVAWSGSIATNATADVTFTGGNQYNFTGSYDTVIAWTDGPNGGVDQYKLNDTFISNTICQPLAGSYTINALAPVSATNFQSFTQLAAALNNCGMTAAVNVTVVAGTYLDNVIFGNVLGNDTTKPITIDGGNAAITFLRRKTMDANSVNYVVRLDKTNTIYFKNITIQNDSLNMGCIIQARGGDKLKFSNCVLEFSGPAATGTSSLNKIIHVTNSYNPNSSVTTFYNSIEIDSCIFNNGYSAFEGSFTNTTCQIFMRNNTINNPYAYGVYSTSNGTFKILGNRFTMRNNGSNSSILIFNSNPSNIAYYSQINGNYFFKNGQNAIYFSSTRGGANNTRRGEIMNNMIGGAFMSTGSNYGMQINYGDFWDIYNNSISMDSVKATSTTRGIYINAGSTVQTVRIKNNSISITDNTAANPYCIEIVNQNNVDAAAGLDFNNYFNSKNGAVLLKGAVAYDSSNYKFPYTAGAGAGSKYGNPMYLSRYNLHTTSVQLDNWGANLGVLKDIDNENRSVTLSDVGADEFYPLVTYDVRGFNLDQPAIQACFGGSSYPLQARYMNSGLQNITLTTDTIYTFIEAKDPNNVITQFGPIKHFNKTILKDSFFTSTFTPNYNMSVYGTYTFKVYTQWIGDGYGYNDSIFITRDVTNPKPVLSPVTKTVFCSNDSSQLSAATSLYANLYQWVKDGVDISGATNSTLEAKLSGKYYCKVTSAAGCTLLTDSVVLTVNPAPTATIVSNKTEFCPGDSVKLSCTFTTGRSYQWLLNNTAITGATDSIFYAKSGGNYSIRVTENSTSCYDFSNVIFILAKTAPTAAISPNNNTICFGDSILMSSFSDPNYQYQWLLNAGIIAGANSNILYGKLAGAYTLFVYDTLVKCATLSSAANITVNPLPNALIANVSQSIFCNLDSAILSAKTDTGQTYTWYKNGSVIGGATDSNYTAKTAGNYQVMVTSTSTGCKAISSIEAITVKPRPKALSFYFGPNIFCAPDSNRIFADTVGGTGNVYQWIKNGIDIPGATNYDYFISSTGNYAVEVVNNGCESYSPAKSIIVGTVPVASISYVSQPSFCANDSSVMRCANAPGLNYQWYRNGSPIFGATDTQLVIKQSGAYSVKVTEALSGCNATSTAITVALFSTNFAIIKYTGPTNYCSGDSVVLNADTVLGSNNVYQWKRNGVDISGATNFNYTVKTTGSYQVTVRKNACVFTSAAKVINIEAPIDTTISINGSLTGCAGSTVTLSVPSNPQVSFKWYRNGSWIGNNSGTQPVTVSGSYYLEISSLQASCTVTTRTIVVNFAAPLSAPQVQSTVNAICDGDSIQITTTNVDPSVNTYKWFKDGVLIPNATTNNYFAKQAGVYSVTTSNPSNCAVSSANAKTLSFYLNPSPILSANKPFACEGDSITLSISNTQVLTNIEWFNSNITIAGETKTSYIAKENGDYSCSVVDFNGCKGKTVNTSLNFYPVPTPVISQNPSNRELVSSIEIGNQWVYNGVKINNAKGPIYRPSTSGLYYTLVTSDRGCVGKSNELNISLLFTGINSISSDDLIISPNPSRGMFNIKISPEFIENSHYKILDAQSKVILESSDMSKLTFDLEGFAAGTYYFQLENKGEIKTIKLVKE